jgi:hypothetical protein
LIAEIKPGNQRMARGANAQRRFDFLIFGKSKREIQNVQRGSAARVIPFEPAQMTASP